MGILCCDRILCFSNLICRSANAISLTRSYLRALIALLGILPWPGCSWMSDWQRLGSYCCVICRTERGRSVLAVTQYPFWCSISIIEIFLLCVLLSIWSWTKQLNKTMIKGKANGGRGKYLWLLRLRFFKTCNVAQILWIILSIKLIDTEGN